MEKSSSFSFWIECLPVVYHSPEDGDASSCKRDDRLGVMFSLAPFSFVEGLGQRIFCGDGAEGALEEDTFERLVSAIGSSPTEGFAGLSNDRGQSGGTGQRVGGGEAFHGADIRNEFCREHRPHPRHGADEGPVRVVIKQCLDVSIQTREDVAGLKCLGGDLADHVCEGGLARHDGSLHLCSFESGACERFGGVQMRHLLQVGCDPLLTGRADFARGDIAGYENEGTFAVQVEPPFQTRMNGAEELAEPGDAACLVFGDLTPARDLQLQGYNGLVIWQYRAHRPNGSALRRQFQQKHPWSASYG